MYTYKNATYISPNFSHIRYEKLCCLARRIGLTIGSDEVNKCQAFGEYVLLALSL
jgi:hypothetical protein